MSEVLLVNVFGVILMLLLIAFCVFEMFSLIQSIRSRRKKKLAHNQKKLSKENEGKENKA